ncbi:MAG TPA: sigma 54-interacting transcriptional regulator [Kofleriaceae bacterium]|nr:sigma 54-interacting transcriptional regulator [Kofleriaceae bacterium]
MSTVDTLETNPGWGYSPESLLKDAAPPRIVVAFECSRPMAPGRRVALDTLDRVIVARSAAGRVEREGRVAAIFVGDAETSRQHLAIKRGTMGWLLEDLGSRNGTCVNGEPIRFAPLSHGDLIEAGGAMLLYLEGDPRWGEPRDRDLADHLASVPAFRTLSVELDLRIQQIVKIARSQVPVLVRGETGTGKELMARAIHDISGRPGAFVAVHCGALPPELVDGELFGDPRGAFSGAADREGLLRRAHNGTLFLDDVAELPPDVQVALLRALQDGELRSVGASEATRVDVRVVAATHQDLDRRITSGLFRPDLMARIAGFEVTMPPLRDRREDLGTLIAAILPRVCQQPERITFHRDAARALFRYSWPHNIRELEQALRAAVALSEGQQIRLEHLPAAIRDYEPPAAPVLGPQDVVLRERLVELLRQTSGNIAAVGRAMDRAPIQIRRWCERLQIDLAVFRH